MDNIYIIIFDDQLGLTVKGYTSLSRLCRENGIIKGALNKTMLPVQIGNKKIIRIELDDRI